MEGRPDWCASAWCYVDPNNCDAAFSPTESSFFTGMYYSYSTCGVDATYDEVPHRYEKKSSSTSTEIGAEIWTILALTLTLILGAIVIVVRNVRAARLKQRPADFRKIISQLIGNEAGGQGKFGDGTFRFKTTHKKRAPGATNSNADGEDHDAEYAAVGPGDDVYEELNIPPELPRSDVSLLEVLGSGQFGQVCKGKLITLVGRVRTAVPVAVKTVHDVEGAGHAALQVQKEFLEEAVVTWQFEHENVVQMHGVSGHCEMPSRINR